MNEKIIVLDPITPTTADRMRALLPPGLTLEHAKTREYAELKELVVDADYIVSGQIPVDAELLAAARKAKLLHKWGVGVDNFDLDAARAQGVTVARTTGSNAVPVAEFAVGLMIALLRNLAFGHAALRENGAWRTTTLPKESLMISGKTVGIIGYGAIGQNVARMVKAFGSTVLYNKTRRLSAEEEAAQGVRFATVPEILAESDIVSLHCPMTPQTKGMIDRKALQSMKPKAVLINCARGGVVIESDLVEALRAKEILGAATDVYETEPVPADHPLLKLDNAVVTPHIAAMAADNFASTINQMWGNIHRVAQGGQVAEADFVC
ncbi:2-hydroxyacid dehydrogenase [Roseomonas marmotae]|uniref:3-phosphoglycerate dehydrogenase n=1 Tax=Roseomonas marmotae TaxID=2768161 RepID=A0ABS3KEE9_9PROT|nr:2-hydroxyacid dehydrogenase [Roseomonas marmotae]MBO1074736.1 3-phosphoglycerate dehydrogenase [Roseomonas marmotae]QTI77802.1 3-phosphoglycerate dehydrogenase [Roseomonas marmotae]